MSLDDWILALHVLSAFAMVGALTLFSILIAGLWNADRPSQVLPLGRLMTFGNAVVIAGVLGTLVFGIWLAVSLDEYEVWDGWIIAAIVFWAIGSEVGRRSGVEYERAKSLARELLDSGVDDPSPELHELAHTPKGLRLHTISTMAILVVLVLMIWKPGA